MNNRPSLRPFVKPAHIREYPVGPCYEAGHLVSENAGWRSKRPEFLSETCIACWQCYMCCPEGVIFKQGKLIAIDWAFCKGCGICAKVCPKKALSMVREGEHCGK